MHRFPRSLAGLLAAALLAFFCSPAYSGAYYKWTDEGGNLHFSDSLENVPAKFRNQIEKKQFDDDKPEPVPSPSQPGLQDKTSPAKNSPSGGAKQPKKYEVPYTPYEGSTKRVIVSVVFNGSVTAPMAIDTGAPGTVISAPLAERIGLFGEDQGRLVIATGGIGGTAPAVRTIIDTMQVGGAKSFFVPTTVIAPLSKSFDGLLGLDFFSNYSWAIDSKRKVVVFEELSVDPDHPGGHDQEWWTALFREFASSRAEWKAYSEELDRKIRDSLRSSGNEDKEKKAFADQQYREAEKLFDKLNRYATQNSVPMHWRQY
jgi:hypothetical protein